MSLLDRKWKYAGSDETRKPGYLREKFRRIQREQAEKIKAEREHKVRSIQRKTA